MGLYSNYIVENNCIVFNSDNDIYNFLDEQFLVINESSESATISSINNKVKELTKKVKNNKISNNELEEELENIYDDIQYIIKNTKDKNFIGVVVSLIISLIFLIGCLITININFPLACIMLCGQAISAIIESSFLNKMDYDRFYGILVRSESEAMRELRIAKQENNDHKIKECEKAIEIYEKLKSKRRTELNQAAHDSIKHESYVLYEYMGNELKTNDMIQTFADIDHYLKYEFEILNTYIDHVEDMISLAKSAKKSNISEITKKCVDNGNNINDDVNKVRDTWLPMSDAMFVKQIKVFSNKYSKLGLAEREKFSEKLKGYMIKVNKIGDKYDADSEFAKTIMPELKDKITTIDYANGQKIIDLIYNWAGEGIIEKVNGIIKYCSLLIKDLNVKGIKSSLIYKIASKFGK